MVLSHYNPHFLIAVAWAFAALQPWFVKNDLVLTRCALAVLSASPLWSVKVDLLLTFVVLLSCMVCGHYGLWQLQLPVGTLLVKAPARALGGARAIVMMMMILALALAIALVW